MPVLSQVDDDRLWRWLRLGCRLIALGGVEEGCRRDGGCDHDQDGAKIPLLVFGMQPVHIASQLSKVCANFLDKNRLVHAVIITLTEGWHPEKSWAKLIQPVKIIKFSRD